MIKIPWDVLLIIARKAISIDGNMKRILYETHKRFWKIPEIKTFKVEYIFNTLFHLFQDKYKTFAYCCDYFIETLIFLDGEKYKGDICYMYPSKFVLVPELDKNGKIDVTTGLMIKKRDDGSFLMALRPESAKRVFYDSKDSCWYIESK